MSSFTENLAPSTMRIPSWWFIFLLNITASGWRGG
jgi:hypothetical protein